MAAFSNRALSSLIEPISSLAEDKGAIGQFLRTFSEAVFPDDRNSLLREAARRESAGDDPWKFLMGVRDITPDMAQVIRAAQSQRGAWRRLLDNAHRWGKLREECEQLRNASPGTPGQPCQLRFFSRLWAIERCAILDDPLNHPAFRAELSRLGKAEDSKLVKRHGRKILSRVPERPCSQALFEDRIGFLLVRWWLRCEVGGIPGLMFFSSGAIAHLLNEVFQLAGRDWLLDVDRIKKKRQRLGLVLACEDNPYITELRLDHGRGLINGTGRSWFRFSGDIRAFIQLPFRRREPAPLQ